MGICGPQINKDQQSAVNNAYEILVPLLLRSSAWSQILHQLEATVS